MSDLRVLALCISGRCEVVFEDSSALIVQPDGRCCTFFHPDGNYVRVLMDCPPTFTRYAIQQAMSLRNKFIQSEHFYQKEIPNVINNQVNAHRALSVFF
jgi:hypothetical protein